MPAVETSWPRTTPVSTPSIAPLIRGTQSNTVAGDAETTSDPEI